MANYEYYCLSDNKYLTKDGSEDLMDHFFRCNLDDDRVMEIVHLLSMTAPKKKTWKLEWFNFSLVNQGELYLDFEYGNNKFPEIKLGWQLYCWDEFLQGSPSLEVRISVVNTIRLPLETTSLAWSDQVCHPSFADLVGDNKWWQLARKNAAYTFDIERDKLRWDLYEVGLGDDPSLA